MNEHPDTDSLEARERALAEREALLTMAQRRLTARSLLQSRQLPDTLIGLLDLSSDEQMQQTLDLAESLLRAPQLQPEAPLGTPPADGAPLSYGERARLYQADRSAYHQAIGGK